MPQHTIHNRFGQSLATQDQFIHVQPEDNTGIVGFALIEAGQTVELRNAYFFRVFEKNATRVTLSGFKFQRSSLHQTPAPGGQTQEVVLILPQGVDGKFINIRNPSRTALEEISYQEVVGLRELITTSDPNHLRPFQEDRIMSHILVCRWVFGGDLKNGIVRRIRPIEADKSDGLHDCPSGDMSDFMDELYAKILSKEVTYGSCFSGCGGDMLGASLAGLKPVFAFDIDPVACNTARANFPQCSILVEDQFNIAICPFLEWKIHCLHISFPCQCWSSAATHRTPNHDELELLMLATGNYLGKFKPLIHTQEQTSGIVTHHPDQFKHLIRLIADAGYNVHWKVMQLRDYGLPASRSRLIIIASRQGVPLPPFPEPEYGPGRHYPHKTVYEAVNFISPDATNHLEMLTLLPAPRPAYNSHTQNLGCITTSGPGTYHFLGHRRFTPREVASLQTFPETYHFKGTKTQILKQIGNAVPPKFWEKIMRSILRTLEDWSRRRIDEYGHRVSRNGISLNIGTQIHPIELDMAPLGSVQNPYMLS